MSRPVQHPYMPYEASAMWEVIDGVLAALEHNQDLTISTARPYVIGALCQAIDAAQPRASRPLVGATDAVQCAICAAGGARLETLTLTLRLEDGGEQEFYIHQACLRGVLHPSVPLAL